MAQPNRQTSPHKEYIRVIQLWDFADHTDRHADVKVMTLLRFERSNGDVFVVDKIIERKKAAALKAGGSGILHRVIARKKEEPGQSEPNPSHEFRIYLDGLDWYIEHDLPDEFIDWEREAFPAGDPALEDTANDDADYCDPDSEYYPDELPPEEDDGSENVICGLIIDNSIKREILPKRKVRRYT